MSSNTNPDDALLRLLSDKATMGLTETEQRELERLLAATEMNGEAERFEIAAAALDLASNVDDGDTELPAELRQKIMSSANEFFHTAQTATDIKTPPKSDHSTQQISVKQNQDPFDNGSSRGFRLRETLGWLVAAASLVFALWIWNVQPLNTNSNQQLATVAQLDSSTDSVDAEWSNVHGKNVSGKVVWSDQLQQGYMVFENLPANDPTVEQYQLWIFDKDVTQATPTDGGVFDIVNDEGASTVFFRPTHPVTKGVQFAVTIETPGGVQKSSRERLPVLATIPGTTKMPAKAEDVDAGDSVKVDRELKQNQGASTEEAVPSME
jgi:hypothetical protein